MNFGQFLAQLENRLGYHQLPVNPAAADIRDVFDSSPVHTELMTRIVRAMYKQNRCHKMADPVSAAKTNEALIAVRLEILRSPKTDVDVFALIDDLCHAVNAIFSEYEETGCKPSAPTRRQRRARRRNGRPADIIPLEQYRYRRLRSSL